MAVDSWREVGFSWTEYGERSQKSNQIDRFAKSMLRHLHAATSCWIIVDFGWISDKKFASTLGQELALGHVDEYDLYAAMRWLLERQPKIEAYLAGQHLEAGAPVLYDLTSTYHEGCI